MIAALYVQRGGVYAGPDHVEIWDEKRDARTYSGPHAVVAHPPCARWGNYWYGSPSSPVRLEKGDDGGCFKAALEAVETWGGVLEHPRGSAAFKAFGLARPERGRWLPTRCGWVTETDQGAYGHEAWKPTWLYFVGRKKPQPLLLGSADGMRPLEHLSKRQRAATPVEFRDLLLALAREA